MQEILPDVADQSSELERRADEAERETDKTEKGRIHGAPYWEEL